MKRKALKESSLEKLCLQKGLRMTKQRRIIAQVIASATSHPDAEEIHALAMKSDPEVSIATVYRTLRLFEKSGFLERHDFGNGRSRYEQIPEKHHDHLINLESGEVIEFHDDRIETIQHTIASRHGLKLAGHRLELYGVPVSRKEKKKRDSSKDD